MEYNDFSILPEEEYNKIRNQYFSSQISPNDFIRKIHNDLNNCILLCSGIDKNINPKLRNEIDKIKIELSELCEDLSFSYNLENFNHNKIEKFNVFKLLKEIIEIIIDIQKNNYSINKNFEKQLLTSIQTKLIMFLNQIIKELNNIEIHIFKHF